MAKFENFWPILAANEGLWANDPADPGGATWKGISYNNYPNWDGWAIIESVLPDFKKATAAKANPILKGNIQLQGKVTSFYKKTQWDVVNADQIVNESVAQYICDWGVNAGFSVPIKKLQGILGLTVDGQFGPKSLAATNAANQADLFAKLRESRIAFYKSLVAQKPSMTKFLNTWLTRCDSIKFKA